MSDASPEDLALRSQMDALASGTHDNPFALLGIHRQGRRRVVRTLQPQAQSVQLLDAQGRELGSLPRLHAHGIFGAPLPARLRHYRLRITLADGRCYDTEDAYRFPSTLGDVDRYLLGEGTHQRIFSVLGAHLIEFSGVRGTRFAVWAPNAGRASVVGDFNEWDGRRHVMRLHPGNGIWEIFVPGVAAGDKYKFELLDRDGAPLPLKADPVAQRYEPPPGNASIVYRSQYRWRDHAWMQSRGTELGLDQPMTVYEVHLGSWRRSAEHGSPLGYRQLAEELIEYVGDMGFTHIELLPVSEHPFDGSWGYQPTGLYAPTHRFGEPDDFRFFVDRCHAAGIGVIVDWVPAHFPKDEHGLRRFDATALYEHEDPRKGEHADWGTLIYNYGRREVVNYLIGSALYWIEEFHIDGLRVDAVASMLYLDYSRKEGEWLPNEQGGNENLEAIDFIKQLNEAVHARGAVTFAEESTAWPGVSRPTYDGGLGFTYKWNMGWMNDTLSYMSEDAVHRKHHHDKMTFGLVYAFNENFVLPLSHDEVVHGKRSLLGRMPGDEWQRFANLRAYYGAMYAHPGKKLLFMGAELAPYEEWNHDASLPWHLLEYPLHKGVQALVRDLNRLARSEPSLHQLDFSPDGFEWIDWQDREQSLLSWLRRDANHDYVVCVMNFTPVIRYDYRLGVPEAALYEELLNTDLDAYGGSNTRNSQEMQSQPIGAHGREHSIQLTVPPLATLILKPRKK